jgi:hypothetical protein
MRRTLSPVCTGHPPVMPRFKAGLTGLLLMRAGLAGLLLRQAGLAGLLLRQAGLTFPARRTAGPYTACHVGGERFPPATVSSS